MLKRYIGDKSFYKTVLALAIPIMIQNAITNFVSMLDNIMVGRVGANAISGVGIANQLIFVYTFLIFGVGAGASIFGAQFFGKGDIEGVRYSFRFKILAGITITAVCLAIFIAAGDPLIRLYLTDEENNPSDTAEILKCAREYLAIMLIGLIPFTISQSYSGTLRECNRTVFPMYSGMAAVVINLIFNYLLIFGKAGIPPLGTNGAAIATVISRFCEMLILIIGTRLTSHKAEFIIGAWRSMKIPFKLLAEILKKGTPLIINELLWAMGVAAMNQCYSTRGIEAVAANNIMQTYFNVFSVAFTAVGLSIGIILGQQLGRGEKETVTDTCRKLIVFSVIVSVIVSLAFFAAAFIIPEIYNIPDSTRRTAMQLMQVCALLMPFEALAQALYFTLRSGGKTLMLFLFDSAFSWVISFPAAFVIANFTDIPIVLMYAVCQALITIKCVFGYVMVKRGSWIRNIVNNT